MKRKSRYVRPHLQSLKCTSDLQLLITYKGFAELYSTWPHNKHHVYSEAPKEQSGLEEINFDFICHVSYYVLATSSAG